MFEEEITFWIDPLDGSSGLLKGHTEHITCIIGVSVGNRPLLGVLHKPFCDDLYPSNGTTFVGIPQCGLYIVKNHDVADS